jgi:hemoglobin/transferrin/lactoferrin receptor protein
MARLVFEPNDMHRLRLTADYGDRTIETEAYSGRSSPPLIATSVIDLDGLDESERKRLTFDYTYTNEAGVIDEAYIAIYAQQASLLQFSDEDRNTAADRTRITTFDNDVRGVSTQFRSRFNIGGAEHTVIFGGDYSVLEQEGLRDGLVPPFGEAFPTMPFPPTEFVQTGLFIQDQIDFMDGRVSFFPALRYDSYEIDPSADALYPLPVAGQEDSRVTPRVGVVAWPTETLGVFFNYAEGFRAPSPNEVNNAFVNAAQGYTSIPNPDLRPETSESLELGVRTRGVTLFGADLRATANVFGSWYDDFIDRVQFGNFGDPAVFQFVNLAEVEIWGAESRADLTWENGFGLTAAISFAEGDYIQNGATAPLESIEPWRIVTGLSYNDPEGRWGGQAIVTHSSKKEDNKTGATFIPDAFTILDITAYLNLTENATLRAGAFNITDEKYWWWNDVRGVTAQVDAYTQPGANFSVSIAYRF